MKRNKFSLSHYNLLSCNPGDLVPVGVTEVLPGDSFRHATSVFLRVSPLLAPVMHPTDVIVHHWFVPYRLIWAAWEDFITGGPDGTSAPAFPTVTSGAGGFAVGGLADHLGYTPSVANLVGSALPFRAYQLIWNEWYRDQDLQTAVTVSTGSGSDTSTDKSMKQACWEKDYFTSARPWPQKGPDVYLPLGTSAPVVKTGTNPTLMRNAATGALVGATNPLTANASAQLAPSAGTPPYQIDPNGAMEADLTTATAVTINQLRIASALQRYMENMARYGSRYVEYLRRLGVRSSDARLQRPEFLGGGRQTIQFSEVLQTAEGTDPVGELRGHGLAAMRSNRYERFFEEHGIVLTLMTVKPKTIYVQGLQRMWNRRTKEDFWQPELQHVGQQEVLNKEVYVDGTATDNDVFGYQDRYDEYRRQESGVHGDFRTTDLDFWHQARIFSSRPALNATFVKANPTNRIYAVPSKDVLWVMCRHNIKARRMVARKGSSFLS